MKPVIEKSSRITFRDAAIDLLRSLPLFKGLDETEIEVFASSSHSRNLVKGQNQYFEGEIAQFLCHYCGMDQTYTCDRVW